jgi:phage/plasmid primase-like uncharacterized protein
VSILGNDAYQFEFCLARRRNFDRLDALLARRRVEEAQEGLVRLNSFVGRLVCNLEGELQGIARAQCDGTKRFCEGDSVQLVKCYLI